MELTKEQSFQVIIPHLRENYFKNKFLTSCKSSVPCLHCGKPAFVGFGAIDVKNIFCPECLDEFRYKRTIVQYHYMKYVKERQLFVTQLRVNDDNPLHDTTPDRIIANSITEELGVDLDFMNSEDLKRGLEKLKYNGKQIPKNQREYEKMIASRMEEFYEVSEIDNLLQDF